MNAKTKLRIPGQGFRTLRGNVLTTSLLAVTLVAFAGPATAKMTAEKDLAAKLALEKNGALITENAATGYMPDALAGTVAGIPISYLFDSGQLAAIQEPDTGVLVFSDPNAPNDFVAYTGSAAAVPILVTIDGYVEFTKMARGSMESPNGSALTFSTSPPNAPNVAWSEEGAMVFTTGPNAPNVMETTAYANAPNGKKTLVWRANGKVMMVAADGPNAMANGPNGSMATHVMANAPNSPTMTAMANGPNANGPALHIIHIDADVRTSHETGSGRHRRLFLTERPFRGLEGCEDAVASHWHLMMPSPCTPH